MSFSPKILDLISALRALPGMGPKSAQRIAMHILEHQHEEGLHLSRVLKDAISIIRRCQSCRTLCESDLCKFCLNSSGSRHRSQLCVVESPMDIVAIEQNASFKGLYFVLMGRISPLDGIGPNELKLHELEKRLEDPQVEEVILATNPTVEGEATAHYVLNLVRRAGKKVSRIAFGVPFGGELEYVDGHTLSHAFSARQNL
jgi:recombination protein RecR